MAEAILVVDDEEYVRDVVKDVLETEGYEVITAADGYEAIRNLERREFSLAVLDLNMPGPGGIEILKDIKKQGRDTEVAIISGADLDSAIEAMRQGAYDYIVKPFQINAVSRTVRRGVRRYRQNVSGKQLLSQLRQRTAELTIVGELRDAIGYTLDYRQLVKPIMTSLRKIIEHDISAFVFLTAGNRAELDIWAKSGVPEPLKEQIEAEMMEILDLHNPGSISRDMVSVHIDENGSHETGSKDTISELKSSLSIALLINDGKASRLAGIMNVNSCEEEYFDEDVTGLLYNIANNISDALERLTKVLNGERNRLEMMVRNISDGVIISDRRGPMTVLNPAARKMLRIRGKLAGPEKLRESIGNTRLFRALDAIWSREDMIEQILGADGFEEEIGLVNPTKYVNVNVSPILAEDGRIQGIMAILRDITRQKEIDEAKTNFVSSISHELRTPLTVIKNAISIIEAAGEINEQQRKFLATSNRNIQRLEKLINRILDFSKLETGKMRMDFGPVDLRGLIVENIQSLRNLAEEKNIQIISHIPDFPLQIYADYYRLEQVFTNLLDNAIKYTPSDGRITVTVEKPLPEHTGEEMNPDITVLPKPEFIKVTVADTGPGIAIEDQKRIFDRFEQSGKLYRLGVGLGLAIARKIVEGHNGKIWVESEQGKGSKFIFILPIRREDNNMVNLLRVIDEEIQVCKAERSRFRIVLMQIENYKDLVAAFGGTLGDKLLDIVAEYMSVNTRARETIIYRSETCGLVFGLYEDEAETALELEGRVHGYLSRCRFGEIDADLEIRIRAWDSVYPDDGQSPAELIEKIARDCHCAPGAE